MTDKILITGATGLIGRQLVEILLAEGRARQLHLLIRREPDRDYGDANVHVAPNDQWPQLIAQLKPSKAVSCLGSTMKKAGSKEAFAAIDRDLIAAVAEASKKAGARYFLAISSTMADSSASNFYLKIKGEAEDAMRSQKFDRLDIIRPGLLRGERKDDPRLGESLAIMASPLMDMMLHGSLRRYRSIDARKVAAAMTVLLGKEQQGEYVHENDDIWRLLKS